TRLSSVRPALASHNLNAQRNVKHTFCHPEPCRQRQSGSDRGTFQLVKRFQACVSNQQMRGPSHSLGMTTCVDQPKIGLLKTRFGIFLLMVIAASSGQAGSVVAAVPATNTRHLVLVVCDGMRPEFVP